MLPEFFAYYRDSVTSSGGILNVHTQDYYELYQLLSSDGELFYFIDDKIYEPNPGDVLIIRSGVPHACYKTVGARYIRVHIRIPIEVINVLEIVDRNVYNFLCNSDISLVSLSDDYVKEYTKLTDEIKVLTYRNSKKNSIDLLTIVLRQLRLLYLSSKKENTNPKKSQNELIRQIVEIVNNNYASLFNVEDIADSLNYSVNHISHYFKKYMKISIHEFLLQKKLSVAKALLASGKSVSECAYSCGFSSPSYFSYSFKKKYGISPSKYIKVK